MLKKIGLILFAGVMLFACSKDIEEELTTGDIVGSVSDKTSGEPVGTVNVVLQPGGKSTVTGSDGTFSYKDLAPGKYTIEINKETYKPNNKEVEVVIGETTPIHLLIERIPAIVTVDKEKIDYGRDKSVNTLSFSIVNSGYEDLDWSIEQNCDWITEIKPQSGTLAYGKTESIVVVIDRNKLEGGENTTVLVVRSSNGSSQIEARAIGEYTVLPALEVFDAENIRAYSALLSGEITFEGTPEYTERGFIYGLKPMPTVDECEGKVSVPKDENLKYSYNVTKLTYGAKYYARAYAINTKGVGYSSHDINFTTVAIAPEVKTKTITDVNYDKGSATLHGEIISTGEPAYSERGFCYGTLPNPTINDNKIVKDGEGTGAYSSYVVGLPTDITFYVRAYAKNEAGIIYGESVSKAPGTAVVETQKVEYVSGEEGAITCYAAILNAGEPPYTERGFVYGASPNPTINDNIIKCGGSGEGSYNTKITGLNTGKNIYVRAYAKNVAGVAYGEQITKTPKSPVISTSKIEYGNMLGSVTFYATISEVGEPAYTERGFVYSYSPNPTINDTKVVKTGTGTGAYTVSVSNLNTGNTIYLRAYAKNTMGVVYGNEISKTPQSAKVTTQAITNINLDKRTATFHGTVVNEGTPAYTERGFVYGTLPYPTINDTKVVKTGTGTGAYSANVTGIPDDATFYVRAYIINAAGVIYGEQVSAAPTLPIVTTQDFKYSETEEGTVTFYGTVVNVGTPTYTERGFVYGTSTNPTIYGDKVVSQGSGVGPFNATASDLPTGETIYVRSYAINSAGVAYGEEVTKLPGMASVKTAEVTNMNYGAGTATFNGEIVSLGSPVYTERGFVYSTLPNPTVKDNKIVKTGTGIGSYSVNATNLPKDAKIYVKAYAINPVGVAYGEEVSVSPTQAVVTTQSITNVNFSAGTATFTGSVTNAGNPAYTERGFAYGTSENPTINDNKVVCEGSRIGSFTVNATNLPNTSAIYVRAYVTTAVGTVYGEQQSVSPTQAVVTT
ncbi:MAG: carboxypeptidase regulatory-like domain-containing protein, partial [Muribaculaceae bacterium]|nr:carboxypeptidase regulatory-like domain-containing protein [Muribaculaceae bacterium]